MEKVETPPAPSRKEIMLSREKTVLGKLRDDAGKIGRALVLVSALVGASGSFESSAEAKPAPSAVKIEKDKVTPKKKNGSDEFMRIIQRKIQSEMEKIRHRTTRPKI